MSALKTDDEVIENLQTHEEYSELVTIKQIEPEIKPVEKSEAKMSVQKEKEKSPTKEKQEKVKPDKKSPRKKGKSQIEVKPVIKSKAKVDKQVRLPELEDSEGFVGRRPVVDPYEPGEVTELELSYLGMTAGTLVFETLPFVEVNGKKAYHFSIKMKSSDGFSMFYRINNDAETFLDFDSLRPFSHEVHIKESKQVKETRSFFDWDTLQGKYWEKKVTRKGERKKHKQWDLVPYSQNLISGLFYIRTFTLTEGKTITFNVADAGKQNLIKGTVVGKETISIPAGEFKTSVMKIQYEVDGTFKQIGDVFLYFTDDDNKRLVKVRAKIKIGSIVGEAIRVK